MQEPDFSDFLLGDVSTGRLTGQGLQLPLHRKHIFDVVRRQYCHHGASVRQKIDNTLLPEELEGFADRRTRYAETDAQQLLGHAHSGQQFALANHIPHLFSDFVVQCAPLDTARG